MRLKMNDKLMQDFKGTIVDYSNELVKRTKAVLEGSWEVGFRDRGMGHGDYAVIGKFRNSTILICECPSLQVAQFICDLKKEQK